MSGPAPFSPHRNFADNLRALCVRHGTIAAVCSAIGMNRQQFNKYLAGSTLPNGPALEKICGFFGVEAESLFREPQPGGHAIAAGLLDLAAAAGGAGDAMRWSTLRPGCHYFYMPWPRDPANCLRAALFIHEKNGATLFSRFTKYRSPGVRQRYALSSRHDGIVLETVKAKYLLATSRNGLSELNLVSIGVESALSQDFMSGLALSMDPSGSPVAMRVALEYRGSAALLRRTISEACILPLADPSIPEEARQSVSAQGQPAYLEAFSLLDCLPQQRRGGTTR
jgi:transcriptional regulator with XRE-family HTH domain